MASSTPLRSPRIKPEHSSPPEPVTSRDLRAARREQQRAQDQLNTAANLGEVSAALDPPVPVTGDVDTPSPPRPHVPVTSLAEHLQRGRPPAVSSGYLSPRRV